MSNVVQFELRNPECWLIFQTRDVRQDQQPTLFAIAETADEAFELILDMAKVTKAERKDHGLAYPMDVHELCTILGDLRGQVFEAMTYEIYVKSAKAIPEILARLTLRAQEIGAVPLLDNDNQIDAPRPARGRTQFTASDFTDEALYKHRLERRLSEVSPNFDAKAAGDALREALSNPHILEFLKHAMAHSDQLREAENSRELRAFRELGEIRSDKDNRFFGLGSFSGARSA